jgi:hypothetical protein
VYNGAVVGGGAASVQLNRQWGLEAGDQNIGVGIPGETNLSVQVQARGAALSYAPNPATLITLFGGMAGEGYNSGEVLFLTPQIPIGVLSIDHYFDPKRRFLLFGRALFSNQQTILGGMLYQTERLQTGFAAGTGSNQPHAEGLLNYKNKQWDISSGYLYSGNRFQLLTLPQFRIVQEDRENIDARWSTWKQASFMVSRHEYLEPPPVGTLNGIATLGSMDSAGGNLILHGMGFGANAYESRFEGAYGSAASFYASQRLSKVLHVNESYYRSLHLAKPNSILVLNVEESLGRRIKLSQFATYVNGQWSVNYGGGLIWDRFDVDIGYATNFIPLAAAGGQFEQSINLDGHVNLGRCQLGVHSYVQPDGSVLYSYEVKSYYFRPTASGSIQPPESRVSSDFPNFLIEGQVRLEDTGKPVADVPVRIGDETVYADETGVFSLRITHKHAYKMQLLLERQIGFHYYEQVSGPTEVIAGTDEAPGRAQFVVRVNQKKVPSLPKGGIVIGNANAAPDDATGSGQGSGDADGPG